MEQTGSRSSRAEKLFNTLKSLAGPRDVIDMEEVRAYFSTSLTMAPVYMDIRKLEEQGAIERIMDTTSSTRIARLKFLKDKVSIPQGKRGRKSAAERVKITVFEPNTTPLLPVAKPVASSRVMVFIDENQLIMSEKECRKFSLDLVLEKVKQATCGEIERVFIYCSEATEKKNLPMVQSLFRPDSPLIRFVKTGSQPGVVDRRIREDMELWSRIDFVSTIVLGTADGGPDFLEAITKAKESGKKLFLLKTGGSFNATLRQLADALIDGTPPNPRRRSFEEIIVAAKDGDFHSGDLNSRFVLAVAMGLKNFFKSGKAAKFVEIVQHIQTIVNTRKEFDGYTEQDLREVLSVLMRAERLLIWRTESGNKVFRLSLKCALLDTMEEFVPVSLQA